MFPYLVNAIETVYLTNTHAWTTTETLSSVDLVSAEGPILITVIGPSGGSGTLTMQPVMATTAAGTYENVPVNAVLNRITGLPSTFTTVNTGVIQQQVALKRDELDRFIGLKLTGSGAQTLTVLVQYSRAYTSYDV